MTEDEAKAAVLAVVREADALRAERDEALAEAESLRRAATPFWYRVTAA